MWFERGRLWTSPEEALNVLVERRRSPPKSRGRDWRPGGEHKDPKARPQVPRDTKRALFKKRLISRKTRGDGPPGRKRLQEIEQSWATLSEGVSRVLGWA
jgi:hypothetical protein